MRLFEIGEAIEHLLNDSVDENGEINEDALTALAELEMSRDERCLAVAAYMLGQIAEADALKAMAAKLTARAGIHQNHANRLRDLIADALPTGSKLADDRCSISWRRSQTVEILDEAKIDEAYWRVRREVAKSEIRDALKAGQDVPGAQLVTRHNLVVK